MFSQETKDRYNSQIALPDANGCWMWQGALIGDARCMEYGVLYPPGGFIKAHRYAWLLYRCNSQEQEYYRSNRCFSGKPQINHRCNHPLCVNPDHLYQGTQKDNVHDMVDAGRALVVPIEEAIVIIDEFNVLSAYAIAKKHNITAATVRKILMGKYHNIYPFFPKEKYRAQAIRWQREWQRAALTYTEGECKMCFVGPLSRVYKKRKSQN